MRITANISRDDLTWKTEWVPLRGADGTVIARVVSARWDGQFTVAEIEIDDAEYAKLLRPKLQKALDDLWLTGQATF